MSKETVDDLKRYKRDKEANSYKYECLRKGKLRKISSCDLIPGDIIKVYTKQRIPADLILLSCSDSAGIVFIRTD